MNVNQKGNVGLTKTISNLAAYGYECFIPLSGASAVDLIVADSLMSTRRIQIKYRTAENGKVSIPFSNVVNRKKVKIDFSKIDGWAVYCPDNDTVYYVSKDDIDETIGCFSIRIEKAKMNQPNSAPMGDVFVDPTRLWK